MKSLSDLIIAVKGAGEMASAVAWRLYMANFRQIFMMDVAQPLAVRRKVSFCEAILNGRQEVEGVYAVSADTPDQVKSVWTKKAIAVAADPKWELVPMLKPDVLIDAIIAKTNLGTTMDEAFLVIGLGPGFSASHDVHLVIETQRGHNLGRIITRGQAAPNTGIPGNIEGFSHQRVLRAPARGVFQSRVSIGDRVAKGDIVGQVGHHRLQSQVFGWVRGMIPSGIFVERGCKLGDIDPRDEPGYCSTISDKARSISGSVLEAVLRGFMVPCRN